MGFKCFLLARLIPPKEDMRHGNQLLGFLAHGTDQAKTATLSRNRAYMACLVDVVPPELAPWALSRVFDVYKTSTAP